MLVDFFYVARNGETVFVFYIKPTTEVLSDVEEEETTTRQQPTKNVVDGKDFVKLTKKALKLGAESLDFSGAPNINFRKISVRETI